MLKLIGLGAALLGGAYAAGVFDHHYARVVSRPPAAVLDGLEHLDIRNAPGAPGTDPSRSGGMPAVFDHQRTPTGMVWTIHSGDRIALRMYADVAPAEEGRSARVTTRVERGDAPDDLVAPAFRSPGVALGLFTMAVESELDRLTQPIGSPTRCRMLIEQMEDAAIEEGAMRHMTRDDRPQNMKEAMGQGASAAMSVAGMAMELRRQGCDTDGTAGEFRPASDQMAR